MGPVRIVFAEEETKSYMQDSIGLADNPHQQLMANMELASIRLLAEGTSMCVASSSWRLHRPLSCSIRYRCGKLEMNANTLGAVVISLALLFWMGIAFAQEGTTRQSYPGDASPADTPAENQSPSRIVIEANDPTKGLRAKINDMDQSRDGFLLPKLGATAYSMDQGTIQSLPQGQDTPLDKVLLQAPGVSYDSAVSNPDFHVRNEYANVQYRINGIQLPEGVSGLGPVLETGFIGNLTLLDGALPAQYGLRTAGVVDITTKSEFTPGGNWSIYGGSLGAVSPSLEYGGSAGSTQYFVTGRYLQSKEGLENAMPAVNPIHDQTEQGKLFGYGSTILGDSKRLTYIAGASIGRFQIPNVSGESPLGDFGGSTLNSANLNEKEYDSFVFGILALQTKDPHYDTQISLFTRYTSAHFVPDVYGDLAFNDVASNVMRKSFLNGIQFDGAYRLNDMHTLRSGFGISAEQTQVDNLSAVLPLDANAGPLPTPVTLNDHDAKLGWNVGAYLQDEWKITNVLTLNTGLRFDQLNEFVTANQFSPRLALICKPGTDTTVHAAYARYFTPPMQAQATPTNLALFSNTSQQPTINADSPVLPERSHYFDVGIDQKLLPGLVAGADAYYKRATDLLDDGQFGQAVVLTQFNYAQGYSEGLEFKLSYQADDFKAYTNVSANRTQGRNVVTNQYLFTDPVEFAYLKNNYIYTDDAQSITASAGASYRLRRTLVSMDSLYGSGLRTGFANREHVPSYTQLNLAIAQELATGQNGIPLTLRLSVVNLLDKTYLLRSGDGIGEFAPQYGPRRGMFVTASQRF